ncbi:MAG: ABC transporter permease [Oscillospiraceae bacterium]
MDQKNKKPFKYLYFLQQMIARDIKKKYYKSVLGLLWTILNPLLMMLVITIVFSTLFKRNIGNYPVYYMCGSLLFGFNSGSTTQSLHSMIANSALLRKIYVPKYMFVLSPIAVNLVNLFFSLIALFVVMLVTGLPFTSYLLLIPIPIVLITIFTTGVSLILSTYGVFFRDLDHLYSVFVTAWMYLTPIFYPISIIPKKFLFLFELNPLYHFVNIFRDLVYSGVMPSQKNLLIAVCYASITFLMGVVTFKTNEDKFYLYI